MLGPAPLFRLKDRFRSVLVMKSRRARAPRSRAVGAAVQAAAAERGHEGVKFAVDVDPQ